jgi:hypothetical protein
MCRVTACRDRNFDKKLQADNIRPYTIGYITLKYGHSTLCPYEKISTHKKRTAEKIPPFL